MPQLMKKLGSAFVLSVGATRASYFHLGGLRPENIPFSEQQNPDKEIIRIQPEPADIEFFTAPEFSFSPHAQKKISRSGEIAAHNALSKTPA